MKLYHVPLTRSLRVIWLLEELGLDYELVTLDRATGDLQKEPFIRLTPLARVPVLEDGDTVLFESGAILQYVLEQHPDSPLNRKPGDPERVGLLQWLHGAETLSQASSMVVQHLYVRPEEKRVPELVEEGRESVGRYFRALDTELASRDYLVGNAFSAADIMLGYTLYLCKMLNLLNSDETPHLSDYVERVTTREAFARTLEKGAD